jgi:hypothetical protein
VRAYGGAAREALRAGARLEVAVRVAVELKGAPYELVGAIYQVCEIGCVRYGWYRTGCDRPCIYCVRYGLHQMHGIALFLSFEICVCGGGGKGDWGRVPALFIEGATMGVLLPASMSMCPSM